MVQGSEKVEEWFKEVEKVEEWFKEEEKDGGRV